MQLTSITVPERLMEHLGEAVSACAEKREPQFDLSPLLEWIGSTHWDELFGPWWGLNRHPNVLWLSSLAELCFNDAELAASVGLDSDEPITDALRVEFGRERIRERLESADETLVPTVHVVPLLRKDGTTAYLGGVATDMGMSGHDVSWFGAFPTEEAYASWIHNAGGVLIGEVDALSEALLLKWWHQPNRSSNPAG
jgi:hypothetical protein